MLYMSHQTCGICMYNTLQMFLCFIPAYACSLKA